MTVTPPVHALPPPRPLRTDPLTALLEALEHIADLDTRLFLSKDELRLTLDYDALCSLANTRDDNEKRLWVYGRSCETLPDGKPLENATPEELRRYTLAMHGQARDLLTPGTRPRDLYTWRSIADEAIYTYRLPRAA